MTREGSKFRNYNRYIVYFKNGEIKAYKTKKQLSEDTYNSYNSVSNVICGRKTGRLIFANVLVIEIKDKNGANLRVIEIPNKMVKKSENSKFRAN